MHLERRLDVDQNRASELEIRKAGTLTGALGALFAILFIASLFLLRHAPGPSASEETITEFYTGDSRRSVVVVGLYLLPLSAVAFIWFIAAIRQWVSHSSKRGSQLIGTVQLLCGVGFIVLALASAAASTVPAALIELTDDPLDVDMARDFPLYGNALLLIFGIHMAAMFVMTTTNIARRAGLLPAWFVYASFAVAAVLFLSATFSVWLAFVFPVWVLVLSVLIIAGTRRFDSSAIMEDVSPTETSGSFTFEEFDDRA